MTALVLRGDARQLPLADASVDLVVTSPPYWALRDYRDGDASLAGQIGAEATPQAYVAALLDCTREWIRVLKPEGSLFVNLGDVYGRGTRSREDRAQALHDRRADGNARGLLGDRLPSGTRAKSLLGLPWRYAIGCADQLGLIIRAEIIWAKPNGLPESVTDRVRRAHEHWFHLVKQPRYFAVTDEIREPGVGCHPRGPNAKRNPHRRDSSTATFREMNGHPLGALPGSVWEIATQPLTVPTELGVDHFAAFPPALVRRIILGWSPIGGTVLDPFGGTGTTAMTADVLGRTGISIDLSADYCRLAQWRTTDPRERARALGVTPPPPVAAGQGDLFDEALA